MLAKYFAIASGIVVLITVIGAFFIIGSPAKARLAQLDQQKVNDLQGIQYQVVNYWQRKGQLPSKLSDLNDSISGYVVPSDPETNQPYEYKIKNAGNVTFELCAEFNVESNAGQVGPKTPYPVQDDISQNWDHGAGLVCFERTIDKQLYPRIEK